MIKHIDIRVIGKVQGVFYRASAKMQADEMGLFGRVKNEPNGDVIIAVEGDEEKLTRFLHWCARGPRNAQVENVIVTDGAMENYTDFLVLR